MHFLFYFHPVSYLIYWFIWVGNFIFQPKEEKKKPRKSRPHELDFVVLLYALYQKAGNCHLTIRSAWARGETDLIESESKWWNYFSRILGKYFSNNNSESSAAARALAPVFLPQRSTLLNSNSIWEQWMRSHFVEVPLQAANGQTFYSVSSRNQIPQNLSCV